MHHYAVLSAGHGWHVRDLQRAGGAQCQIDVIDFTTIQASARTGTDPLRNYDALMVRTMPAGSLEQIIFRMDVLLRLEAMGQRIYNPPRALELCIDKYLATATMSAAGLPVPQTMVHQDAESAMVGFEALGGDVVVKPLFGSEGRGMMRISDMDLAWRTFRALEQTRAILYLQKFIPHHGYDLRIFVLGNQPLIAMRRRSDSWRTNVAQGGRGEKATPSPLEIDLALRAAKACNVPIAGVDILPGKDGTPYVLELNAVPGWRKLASVTKVDVASEILKYISSRS